jgi:hypothetical protein
MFLDRLHKRANYSREVTEILNNWLDEHIHYPYPAEDERIELCQRTGLSRKQLRVWFINARKVSGIYKSWPLFYAKNFIDCEM